jgi:hypothetical protein
MNIPVYTVIGYTVSGGADAEDAPVDQSRRGVSEGVYYGYIRGIYPEYGSQVCIYSIFNNK